MKDIGALHYNDDYDVEIVTLFDAQLPFGNRWGTGKFDVDDLIDGADYIDELPFVQLKDVVDYKLEPASAKDLLHIESLEQRKYFALVGETD